MVCENPVDARPEQVRWDLVALVLTAVVFLAAPAWVDPDLWGHVRFGQDMLRDGVVHDADPYSYLTAGTRWINHEVLSEVAFGWAYNHFGDLGLSALRVMVVLLATGLLLWHVMRAGLNPIRAGAVVIVVYYCMSLGIHFVRPQMFTYLFFACIVMIIDQVDRGRIAFIWAAAPVIAIWANFHGGFLAGIAVLGIWLAADLVSTCVQAHSFNALACRRSVILMAGGLLALCSSLATPYGWRLVEFLLRTATIPRPEIQDWHPISLISLAGAAYMAVLLASLWAIFVARVVSPASLATWAVCAYLPFSAARHLPLFALASGFLLARGISIAWNQASPSTSTSTDASPGGRRLAIHAAACVLLLVAAVPRFAAGVKIDAGIRLFPVRAVSLLEKAGVEGNLATEFGWGEYVIWNLGPDIQVSIDGRRETVYSPDVYAKNLALSYGVGDWDAILTDYPTDMVLAPRNLPMYERMSELEGWSRVYNDEICGLFVREDFAARASLEGMAVPNASIDGLGMRFDELRY